MTDTSSTGAAPAAPAPIVVNQSPVPDQVESQIGPLVAAAGGVVTAFGLMAPTKWAALAGLLPIVLTMGWRYYRSTQNHAQRVIMADAAPDAVAVVRKP
jgi:hypothetical protein